MLAVSSVATVHAAPDLLPDGRVAFRIDAGEGRESVVASGQFGADVELKQVGDGEWAGTTAEPVGPGIYEYAFEVDGLGIPDPGNRAIKPQRWPGRSILHVPADPPAPWDWREISHGTLHHHDYESKALGKRRRIVVYTPPGMGDEPLPVLYLSHGFSDHEETWTVHGKAHWILDALIHEKQAVPMIVVMPDAHALPPARDRKDRARNYGEENSKAFVEELTQDVIPLVEKTYPARTGREHRAFAGLSMGGGHALHIALHHHDRFSEIGAFSAGVPRGGSIEESLADPAALNQALDLFWIACGDEDFLFERNQALHAALEEAGVEHTYLVTAGEDHSWPVWRRYLARFAPLLFREE